MEILELDPCYQNKFTGEHTTHPSGVNRNSRAESCKLSLHLYAGSTVTVTPGNTAGRQSSSHVNRNLVAQTREGI
jgi:hypothetical protein